MDRLQSCVEIVHHVASEEAKGADASVGKPGVAALVALRPVFGEMSPTVHLNRQPRLLTVEVQYVRTKGNAGGGT